MATDNTDAVELSAPLWRRFAALLYDLFILAALSMAYGAMAVVAYVVVTGDHGEAHTPMFQGPWFQLGWITLIAGFYLYFWRRGGQTLGMRAWRLCLRDPSGKSPSLKRCLIRSLTGVLSLALVGLGYWWKWLDRDNLCWHDRLSGTQVVVLPKAR